MTTDDTVVVIANPHAGRGTDAAVTATTGVARATGVAVEVATTTAPGQATTMATAALEAGHRHIVVVGGDGTLNEVINGIVDVESGLARADGIRVGIVSAGTGSDFARTFGLDRRPEVAARHALQDTTMAIDIGRVRCRTADGSTITRAFANMVTIGWTAAVVARSDRLPRRLGRARYVVAGVAAAPTMKVGPVTVALDHTTRTDEICEVIVANGQFFGAGLKVAPRALPDDGRLNIQTWATGPLDVLRELPRVSVGEHLERPDVREWQSAKVTVTPPDGSLAVEADGDPLGTTPVTVDLLPGILDLAV